MSSGEGVRASTVPVVGPPGLEDVYADQFDRLVRLAFVLTSSTPVAHDIVQDAFAAAARRWSEVREPTAYLRRAVVNGAADHHRRGHRASVALGRHGPAEAATPADEYLTDAIAALPFRQQAVVVLRFWAGLDTAQIAAAVGCRPGSVGPTLTRALRALRTALEEET